MKRSQLQPDSIRFEITGDMLTLDDRPPAGGMIEYEGNWYSIASYAYSTTLNRWFIHLSEQPMGATIHQYPAVAENGSATLRKI